MESAKEARGGEGRRPAERVARPPRVFETSRGETGNEHDGGKVWAGRPPAREMWGHLSLLAVSLRARGRE